MMHVLRKILISSLFFFCHGYIYAGELIGNVVGISDGDTVTLLVGGHEKYVIRLVGIDAPEKRQAFGSKAKHHLSDLAFQKQALVAFDKHDRYGRVLGKVFINGVDINLRMLEAGYAWHYKQYAKEQSSIDRESYSKAEEFARLKRVGLWSDESPIPPWTFRHGSR